MAGATTQGANLLISGEFNHSFTFIHHWCSNGSNLGLSVLPMDTSTCGLEEPGIKPPIFQLAMTNVSKTCTYEYGKWTVLIWHLSSLYDHSKRFTCHSPIHTHSHTDGRSYHTGCQPAHQGEFNHSFSFIHRWRNNGSNLGLSVLPKDTSTCGLEEPGI